MKVRITKSTPAGLIEGAIKDLPQSVAKSLIKKGLAVIHSFEEKDFEEMRCKLLSGVTIKVKAPVRGKKKVVAYMATFPARKAVIGQAIQSLINQVDAIVIWANHYTDEDADQLSMTSDKLHVFTSKHTEPETDLGCVGKFALCESWSGYVLTVDDDFLYPDNYVSTVLEAVDRYEKKAVISVHGRRVSIPTVNYYTDKGEFFQCTKTVSKDEPVDIVGTGVMAFHTDAIKPLLKFSEVFTHTNMSDISFSIAMKKAGIPIMVIAHSEGWLKAIPQQVSIGARTKLDCQLESELINQYWHGDNSDR